jgi:4-alpha-glucanotransferase
MTDQEILRQISDYFGILPSYCDFSGQERVTSDETRKAFLAANGVDVSSNAAIADAWYNLRTEADQRWFPTEVIIDAFQPQDMPFGLGAAWQVSRWDDMSIVTKGQAGDFIRLPPLQPDVYEMRIDVAGRTEHVRILAAPQQLPLLSEVVSNPKVWGMTAALYGLQSARSTAVGDFDDLGALCRVAGAKGAAFVGINPVHNMGYANTRAISPYSPSHRGFYNTDHIALDSIPGLELSDIARKAVADIAPTFALIKNADLVDYDSQKRYHRATLEVLYIAFKNEGTDSARNALDAYCSDRGAELERFARFEALCEVFGSDWRQWPEDSQNDQSAPSDRKSFHSWLQWISDHQLGRAQASARGVGMPLGLYLDLSVGSRHDGAESWCEQASIATGVSIGAPPDHLAPDGQNWDLAAFSPSKLEAAGYAPLRTVLAQTMRHAGGIRIDHVLGLNRSFWIPDNGSPGGYIRQPFESLLAVIKIEAYRTQTIVIGEDLGLVPDGFRETMRGHGFYGYSVLQYEKEPDGQFRNPKYGSAQMISCFGTHDTPTIRGYEIAHDIDWWEKLGSLDSATAAHLREARQGDVEALKSLSDEGRSDIVQAVHRALASSAAEMICLQLDDILERPEAQNLPGTVDQHPNWRRRHSVRVGALGVDEGMVCAARLMKKYGRSFNSNTESENTNDL